MHRPISPFTHGRFGADGGRGCRQVRSGNTPRTASMTCLTAMAEERPSETALLREFGLTMELASLRDACANDFALDSYGVRSHDPYAALGLVKYCLLPTDTVNRIFDDYEALPAEKQAEFTDIIEEMKLNGARGIKQHDNALESPRFFRCG